MNVVSIFSSFGVSAAETTQAEASIIKKLSSCMAKYRQAAGKCTMSGGRKLNESSAAATPGYKSINDPHSAVTGK